MSGDILIIDGKNCGFTNKGIKYLTRCPKCDKENWAIGVYSGVCSWCGFDCNKEIL